MPSITSNTTFTLTKGASVIFELGGSGTATVAGQIYSIGNREAFIGPFDRAVSVVVAVENAPIGYRIDGDGDLSDQVPALAAISEAVFSKTPLYIDLMTCFGRGGYGTPSGLTNYPTINDAGTYEVNNLTVTGAAGQTTLTINTGTVADLAGTWAACVLHNDGIWRTYTVKNATGSTLDVFPPLEAAATNAQLRNVQDALNGQHLTEAGSFCLADYLFDFNPLFACRQSYYERVNDDATSGWSLYGGLNAGRLSHNQAGNVHIAWSKATQMGRRRTKTVLAALNTNQGVNKVYDVTGKSGYFEVYLAVEDATVPARVDVLIDGNVVYRKDTFGFEVVRVPFAGATSLECRIYSTALQTGATHIGAATLWKSPTGVPSAMFGPSSRVVWLGDSWTYRQAAAIQRRLQQRGASKGISVNPIGAPGQQATWAIANFDKVVAAAPTQVVIEYFVNDLNSLTESGLSTWRDRLNTLVTMVQNIGAQPIVLMGAPTGAQVQCQSLANWSAQAYEGTLSV